MELDLIKKRPNSVSRRKVVCRGFSAAYFKTNMQLTGLPLNTSGKIQQRSFKTFSKLTDNLACACLHLFVSHFKPQRKQVVNRAQLYTTNVSNLCNCNGFDQSAVLWQPGSKLAITQLETHLILPNPSIHDVGTRTPVPSLAGLHVLPVEAACPSSLNVLTAYSPGTTCTKTRGRTGKEVTAGLRNCKVSQSSYQTGVSFSYSPLD
jgi:hypothetical protein